MLTAGGRFAWYEQIRVKQPLGMQASESMAGDEAYVLSRLSGGGMNVKGLCRVCPMKEEEVFSVLEQLVRRGIVYVA